MGKVTKKQVLELIEKYASSADDLLKIVDRIFDCQLPYIIADKMEEDNYSFEESESIISGEYGKDDKYIDLFNSLCYYKILDKSYRDSFDCKSVVYELCVNIYNLLNFKRYTDAAECIRDFYNNENIDYDFSRLTEIEGYLYEIGEELI